MRIRGLLAPSAAAFFLAALTLAPAAAPARLASPQEIAYSDVDGNLYVDSIQGNAATTIYQSDGTTTMTALSLSPDGSNVLALATADQNQLVLVPTAGGAPVPVSGTDGADSGSFSPDGKQIVFSIDPDASATLAAGIYSVSASGGTPSVLVTSPDGAIDSLPQLSPSGSQLAFARDATDSNGNETVALELAPVAGGTATQIGVDLIPRVDGGGRISFSPDGGTILYAGDANPGIFNVTIANGDTSQLTTDSDYWPSFSADGSTVFFSRDAFSADADDNAETPVSPSDNDVDELWTMSADGTDPAVVAEGDYEGLSVTPYASKGSSGGSGGSGGGSTTTKAKSATAIHVAVHGSRYVVTWKGKASTWKVTLKVGKQTVATKVKGTLHTHTFTLHGAKGTARASVKSA